MQDNDTLAIKDLVATASPIIKTLVDTFVTPKLEQFRDKFKGNSKINLLPTESHFTEYYHRTYKRLIVVSTLVFNNSQRLLNEIFLPLTLTNKSDEKLKVKISGYPQKISDEFGNILITDTAGMGKSTLMKVIFIDIVNNNIGIPIFIELRRLSANKKLLQEIQEQINSLDKSLDLELLRTLLADGGFVIILDGYDEISLVDRDVVTADIQDFISKAPNNRYFMTSRPEKALVSFGNFQEFKIEPLAKKEAYELLRKYDNQGHISALLIKKLEEQELDNIQEFLTNPLLVSLLFTAFEYKQAIPFKKYLFYRQVYDANFESHDLTKGDSFARDKYCKLEIDDFHRVLRHIGYNSFKVQKIEFSKDELLKLISDSRTFCIGLEFSDSDFLLDILKTVPLFAQDGNYYRWSHKSLQEYFAAQFIYLDSKGSQNAILSKFYNHKDLEKFINVLDLYYDMDYKTFRNVIEYQLLEEYKQFVESYEELDDINISDVVRRKELMFLHDSFIFRASEKDGVHPFDGSRLGKMINDHDFENERNKFTGVLVGAEVKDFYMLHYQNNKMSILSLLNSKKNSLIKSIPRVSNGTNSWLDFIIEDEFKLVHITMSRNDPKNSKEHFSLINDFLQSSRVNPISLDNMKALEQLDKIKNDLKESENEDFLKGF